MKKKNNLLKVSKQIRDRNTLIEAELLKLFLEVSKETRQHLDTLEEQIPQHYLQDLNKIFFDLDRIHGGLLWISKKTELATITDILDFVKAKLLTNTDLDPVKHIKKFKDFLGDWAGGK